MSATTPRPPALPGFPEPRTWDVVRMVGWMGQGFARSMTHSPSLWGRAAGFLLVVGWVASVLLLGFVFWAQWALVRRKNARYYMSPDRDAVLALVAKDGAWDVGDHMASRIGAGLGRQLRAALMPPLFAAATTAGVSVTLTAANSSLAARYAAEAPGLVDVGRAFPRGRKMRRP